jgi:ComF family protein
MWQAINRRVQQFVLPPICALCHAPSADPNKQLCAGCDAELQRNTRACRLCAQPLPALALESAQVTCGRCLKKRLLITQIVAPFQYAHPLDSLVLRFKKRGELACGATLAALFIHAVRSDSALELPQALVPVPLHRVRLRERGFDQARLLAQAYGTHFNIPLRPELLIRTRHTGTQAGLSATARVQNVRGAFFAAPTAGAKLPAHVALIDDVATTAATLNACALALKRAGVTRVDAWVLARA